MLAWPLERVFRQLAEFGGAKRSCADLSSQASGSSNGPVRLVLLVSEIDPFRQTKRCFVVFRSYIGLYRLRVAVLNVLDLVFAYNPALMEFEVPCVFTN